MNPRYRAYLSLTASMALVGVYVALSRPLTGVLPVFLLALLRFAIAAPAMLPWTLRAAGEPPLTAAERRNLFLMSFFGNFLFSICMLFGMSLTTACAAGVIMSSLPAVVALLSRVLLGERLGVPALAAVALAVGGIALLQLARGGQPGDAGAWRGDLLVLGSVVCEALYVVIGKRLAAARAPLRVSALINLWGLVLMLPLGLWQALHFDWSAPSPASWGLLVFYSLSASLVAVGLWMRGLRHVPAHQAGVFTVALPLAATAVGVLWLGESVGPLHLLALASALAGIGLVARAPATALAA